ncbi:sodium-dependent transporter [Ferrovibrio sp.]|uniref:sodium-dependent transporter n=1 Tax=Ferrovibrio sp. TaxID=1917215 RepID=UPI002638C24E|nr:sodium-dependent transporter [Ferrovibrio sp.]
MSSPNIPQRGQWSTSLGFVLAALGSAVGIGNIWRFSYVVGENGGGAFIVVYLLAVIGLGVPLLIAELAIGQRARANAVAAFEQISGAVPWRWTGWLGIVAGVTILSYYPVITGWVARYGWIYLAEGLPNSGGAGFAAFFEGFIADPVQSVIWFGAVLAAAAVVVAAGVERGIERASRILMPVFVALVILLAGYGLSLPGATRALAFMFAPDWNVLREPKTYLAAVGQAFFSIGLGMGILVTYGSYLPNNARLPRAACVIAAGDTIIALIAGLMIFPAVFTLGLEPTHGPTLAFVVLPEVFAALPAGRWIAVAFFLLLLVAALTSVIAMLEVPVSLVMEKWQWPRPAAVFVVAAVAFASGIPAALGFGVWRDVLPVSIPWLDLTDDFASTIVLPLSGIAIALFAGWIWPMADALQSSGLASAQLRYIWIWLLRIVLPGIIALVMVRGLGLI